MGWELLKGTVDELGKTEKRTPDNMNCSPHVRQYGILNNRRRAVQCL